MTTEIDDPAALLAAANAGARLEPLDDSIEVLVRDALRDRTWGLLTAASRALRTIERHKRSRRRPVPARVAFLLSEVRAAMAQRQGGA